jgi:hypothetical protein
MTTRSDRAGATGLHNDEARMTKDERISKLEGRNEDGPSLGLRYLDFVIRVADLLISRDRREDVSLNERNR